MRRFDEDMLARLSRIPLLCPAVLTRLGLILLFVAAAPRVGAQERVGYVLHVEGVWHLAGDSRPIVRGQQLKAGDIIRNDAPDDSHSLVVVDNQGQTLLSKNCKLNFCRRVTVPAPKQSSSLLHGFLKGAMRLWRGEPDRFSVHITRGGFRESVLELREGRVDFGPAFEHLTADTYHVELRPLSGGAAADGKPPRVEVLVWSAEAGRGLSLQGLALGLYEMTRLQPKNKQPTLDSAWVLIANGAGYEYAAPRFAEVKRLALEWEKERVDRATIRSLLRAFLDDLARGNAAR